MSETPFDNVEGAHEYVGLLLEAVKQARVEVGQDLEKAKAEGAERSVEALQLVAWKLERLESQLLASRHLLNDLRRLRRLLLGEDGPASPRGDADEPLDGA
ncbi:MAG TPA: hypothetical protein VMT70_13005 [Vicinamibacteria bacterium]|nr:hypothetical protein [Vicinamibacteria bacterium]